MKQFILFCLLIVQSSVWSQSDTARFVIRTAGFYIPSDDYDLTEDTILKKWDIMYLQVAGCISTTEFADSINQLNDLTYKRLKAHYGTDWKKRFDAEIEAAQASSDYKKEHTFKQTANCITEQYTFYALENLSQTEMKLTVIPKTGKGQNNRDIRLAGLQNVDPTILYRGYDNRISVEFGSLDDTVSVLIKSNGEIYLSDSCPASTKIKLGYRPSGSVKSDTLLVETGGKVQQYIFHLKNMSPPGIYFNEEFLDSTLSISSLKEKSVLSMHYDQDCLIPDRFSIHSWEIWFSENKPLSGAGDQIPVSVISKLKTVKPGTKCSILVTVSTPGGILRKKIVYFTLTN